MKLSPRQKWWLKRLCVLFWIGLLFPVAEVVLVKFFDPPTTLPMSARWLAGRFKPAYVANEYHWNSLRSVSEDFLTDVWIIEDCRFFEHHGFDWQQIQIAREQARASGRPARGASTITQQCARSLFLWQGRSWFRKGLEAYYTVWMELILSKGRVLELYANVIELGDGIYGIEAAAQKYYGVSSEKLTHEQAAMLVAIMPNPKQWNPLQPSERVVKRQELVLQRSQLARLPFSFRP